MSTDVITVSGRTWQEAILACIQAIRANAITVGGYDITKLGDSWEVKSEFIPWDCVRETFLWLAEKFAKVSPGPMVEIWFVPAWEIIRSVRIPAGREYRIGTEDREEYRFRCLFTEKLDRLYADSETRPTDVYEAYFGDLDWSRPPTREFQEAIDNARPALESLGAGWFEFAARTDNQTKNKLPIFFVKIGEKGDPIVQCGYYLFYRVVKNYSPAFHELAQFAGGGLAGREFKEEWGQWFAALCLTICEYVPPTSTVSLFIHDAALASEKLCRQIASSPKVWEKVLTGHISYDRNFNLGFLCPENSPIAPSGKDDSGNGEPTESQATLLVEMPVKIPVILKTWKDVDKYLADKIQWPSGNQERRRRFLQAIIKQHAPHLLPERPGKWPRILSTELDSLIPQLPDLIRQETERKSTRPKAERKRPKKDSGSTTF